MLKPEERQLLLASLKPPDGYDLDYAIGTSFTLDLLSLLTVPVGFTFSEWYGDQDESITDVMALLEALRRYSDRLSIFCQAGHIYVPGNVDRLYGYLENSVHEVVPEDSGGVFHPKIWVLRFLSKKEKLIRYRLLCSSRNLSADRSWDTLLALDGEVVDRDLGISANHPLADFIAALPKCTIRPLPEDRKKYINKIQQELRRTRFELPDGFESYKFLPLGIADYHKWPFDLHADRILVMAPFIDEGFLDKFDGIGSKNILISRLESLNMLPEKAFRHFDKVYYFNPEAKPEEDLSNETQQSYETVLDGLHAKLFIIESGWDASLLTGSANATSAAFYHNVEFLTELRGKKSQFGIEQFLNKSDKKEVIAFWDLLHEFIPGKPDYSDIKQKEIEKELNCVRNQLSQARIQAKVMSIDGNKTFRVQLSMPSKVKNSGIPPSIKIKCWPITISENIARSVQMDADILADFDLLSYEALTTFFAFEVSCSKGEGSDAKRFVLNLPLDGAPPDRRERFLLSFISDRNKLIRFLFFLLVDERPELSDLDSSISSLGVDNKKNEARELIPIRIFEMLVRSLHRDPDRLDQVDRLIRDLKKSKEGQGLLPDEFDLIWEPIWQARQETKNEKR